MKLALTFACLTHFVLVFAQQLTVGRSRILFPEDGPETTSSRPVASNVLPTVGNGPVVSNVLPTVDTQRCTTPDGQIGRCIVFDQCLRFTTPVINFDALRRYQCGFEGHLPRVCCPNQITRSLEPEVNNVVTPTIPPKKTSNRPHLLPEECGRTQIAFRRIVNGEEARPGAWPWLAALYIGDKGRRHAECGAALISSNYVITAAHCVTGDAGSVIPARMLSVRFGVHNISSSSDEPLSEGIDVVNVTRHENFQSRTFLNDIALLRLQEEPVINETVGPICLPYDPPVNTEDLQGKNGIVAGWGTTSFDGPASDVVRQVALPVWNHTACRHAYRNDVKLNNAYLCAGFSDGSKDACQGDSGGPLVVPASTDNRFHLVGIVSFGKRCAEPGFPGVYTNVRQFLPWIAQNIN